MTVFRSAKSGLKAAELRFLYLSPASRYALLGMRCLARGIRGNRRPLLAGEVARLANLPANMLAKIFQRLARSGLLWARRGPGGGYALAKPAPGISLADILITVQDIVPGGRHCLLKNNLCDAGQPCLIHRVIGDADRRVISGLAALTLDDLAKSKGWS